MATAFWLLSQSPHSTHTLTGNFRMHSGFHSRFVSHDRDVLVYLPPDYDANPDRRYPVLYMHDGQNVFDGATSFIPGQEWRADENAEELIRAGKIAPLIIVGIYNTPERMNEYTQVADPKYKVGGKADDYGRMLIEDLKPFIDSHYRTVKDADHTGICGSSLGALVSLYLGLTHPDIFGRIAVISPSVFWGNRDIVARVHSLPHKLPLRIWMDVGTKEGSSPGEVVRDAELLRDALQHKGWVAGRDLHYSEVAGARHNEAAWSARFGDVLQFLFPAASAAVAH